MELSIESKKSSPSISSGDEPEYILINPYNPMNRLIETHEVEAIIKEPIGNLKLYQNAFVHKSYCVKKGENIMNGLPVILADKPAGVLELQENSNERLEFLGDSILGAVVTHYLYNRFGSQDEGFCTKLKTKLVNCETLASFSRCLGLDKHLIISKYVEDRCNGRRNPRILEDIFESFIGALFLDFQRDDRGFAVANRFILRLLERNVDFTQLILHDNNYKDILLRYYQHNFQITPKYKEIKVDGPAHQRMFTMGVMDKNGKVIGVGEERSKKKAEQIASKNALLYYGQLEDSDTSDFSSSDDD